MLFHRPASRAFDPAGPFFVHIVAIFCALCYNSFMINANNMSFKCDSVSSQVRSLSRFAIAYHKAPSRVPDYYRAAFELLSLAANAVLVPPYDSRFKDQFLYGGQCLSLAVKYYMARTSFVHSNRHSVAKVGSFLNRYGALFDVDAAQEAGEDLDAAIFRYLRGLPSTLSRIERVLLGKEQL